jgi:hypothetical protein
MQDIRKTGWEPNCIVTREDSRGKQSRGYATRCAIVVSIYFNRAVLTAGSVLGPYSCSDAITLTEGHEESDC